MYYPIPEQTAEMIVVAYKLTTYTRLNILLTIGDQQLLV